MLTGHRDDKHRQVWLWEWEVWGWILFSFGSDLEGEGTSKSLQNDIWNLPLVGVRQARALEKTGKAKGASYCPRYTGSLENSTIVGPALGLDEHFLKPEGRQGHHCSPRGKSPRPSGKNITLDTDKIMSDIHYLPMLQGSSGELLYIQLLPLAK